MNYYAIIVAGGSGNRMKNAIPKQFLLLEGKPILMHTIAAFDRCTLNPEILVVLSTQMHEQWNTLCLQYDFKIPHRLLAGGHQRFFSVKNGLSAIDGAGIVAVHDGVRPLVSAALITRSYEVAEKAGNCVCGVMPTDSIRRTEAGGSSKAYDRNEFMLIQTPQTFDLNVLRAAYEVPYQNWFTDDAAVVEYSGVSINIIPGERENLKITYPEDLEIASILIKKDRSS